METTEIDPGPHLLDPWDVHGPVPLNGWFERNKYGTVLTLFIGLILAFVLFQLVISPITVVVLLIAGGVPPEQLLEEVVENMDAHIQALLTANTIGQVFGLAVPAYLLARLHSTRAGAFLRFRSSDAALLGLSVLGLVILFPVVQWLGQLNESIPLPEWLRMFETAQMDLIESVLGGSGNMVFNMLVLAVTPAVCEELFFRGYIQRQAERSFGMIGGIIASGLIFGLYHLRLSQVIPLCLLGIFLAYLCWRTGSLWPVILVHFINNGVAVALGALDVSRPELGLSDLDNMQVPWYIVIGCLLVFTLWARYFHRTAASRCPARAGQSGAFASN